MVFTKRLSGDLIGNNALINTVSLELENFTSKTPEYSILSHTWADGDSEVSFQDFTSNANQEKLGWTKI